MPIALSFILISVAALSVAIGAVYYFWIRPAVCFHFGEEFPSRRDRNATRRRRSFEWRCGRVAVCLFIAGTINAVAEVGLPISTPILIGSQFAALLVGALFLWAAIARWKAPFED